MSTGQDIVAAASKIPRPVEICLLGAILSVFAALALDNFASPGYMYDSIHDEVTSAMWVESLRGGDVPRDLIRPRWSIYHGSLTAHLMLPFFFVFGEDLRLVRAMPIAWGGLTLLLAYIFVKRDAGTGVALTTAGLLAVHPSFVMGCKVGMLHVSYMAGLSTGALILLRRWRSTGSGPALFAAGCLLGLGLGTRLWFLWFVVGASAAWALTEWAVGRPPGPKALLIAVAGFLAGAHPVILTEANPATTVVPHLWDQIARKVVVQENYHSPLKVMNAFLEGKTFWAFFGIGAPPGSNEAYPFIFWTSALICFAGVLFKPRWRCRGFCSFVLCLFAVMFATYMISPPRADPHPHLFVFFPIPQLIVSLAAFLLWEALPRFGPLVRAAVALAIGALMVGDLQALGQVNRRLGEAGAVGRGTDSIYDLAGWLRSAADQETIVICDNSMLEDNLRFMVPGIRLTNGMDGFRGLLRLDPRDGGDGPSERKLIVVVQSSGGDPRASFIPSFRRWATEHPRLVRNKRVFIDGSGAETFSACEVRRLPPRRDSESSSGRDR